MNNIIKIVMLLIGSLVGAGFASGQEINLYFNKEGIPNYLGLFFSISVIAVMIYVTIRYVNVKNIQSYESFLLKICRKNKVFAMTAKNLLTIFLLLSFYIMIIGFAAVLYQEYQLPKWIGIVAISIMTYLTLQGDISRVTKASVVIVPIIIIFIIYIGIKSDMKMVFLNFKALNIDNSNMINGLIYAGYNFVLMCPLIISLKNEYISKSHYKIITIILFSLLSILGYIILNIITRFNIEGVEIPILYITHFIGGGLSFFSLVLILSAIYTSIVCIGYSFLNNVTENISEKHKRKYYLAVCFTICFSSLLFINMEFSKFMFWIYSFLGVLGIIQILAILLAKFSDN